MKLRALQWCLTAKLTCIHDARSHARFEESDEKLELEFISTMRRNSEYAVRISVGAGVAVRISVGSDICYVKCKMTPQELPKIISASGAGGLPVQRNAKGDPCLRQAGFAAHRMTD